MKTSQIENNSHDIKEVSSKAVYVSTLAGKGPNYSGFANGLGTFSLLNAPNGGACDSNSDIL